jgi:Ca-activated chloride channel family protein
VAARVERAASHVRADLDGHVVRYEVSETYVNRGNSVGEADFLLPLPKGAAFEDLALSINGEMVTGETMGADRARAIYEEIVRRMRDPALVEWMGYGLLRTRIFPIQPGEEKRVVVRFRAVAEREGGALRVDWLGARRGNEAMGTQDLTLSYADDGTLGDAYSPTNTLRAAREDGRRVFRTELSRGAATMLVPVRSRVAAVSLLAHAPSGEDGYALITLSPPVRSARETPRDIVLVIDVSGSMSGRKIQQARAAGRQLLQSLTSTDRFRMIDFSSDVRSFRDGWSAATGANLRAAAEYLDGLRANGGTNIQGALEEALAAGTPEGRLPLVLFLTDGAPTVGETRPEAIAQRAADLRRQRRVFTFGIGADVNAALVEQLALQGRGTATFVRPEESVERAVGIVTERFARPVATDVRLRIDGVRLYAVQPQGEIDLFAGQDLVVLARFAGARENATLVIEGRTPDGPVRWTGRVSLPVRSSDNAFVARLWATQRVGYLSAERRRTGGNTELDAELRQLGERHGIPTELTSYLVKELGMVVAGSNGAGNLNIPVSAPVARFESARAAAEQRAAKSVGEFDSKDESLRRADSHTFALRDGVWTDTRQAAGTRVLKVKAFSNAYFALVHRLPELGRLFGVGTQVRVQGRAITIEVGADGRSDLDDASLDAVVRDW